MNDLICWHDRTFKKLGEVAISPLDFGFIHSEATYDVMRSNNKRILFTDLHLARFENSSKYFNFEIDFDILSIANQLLEKNNLSNAFIWTIAWRGIPPSGSPRDLNAPQHNLIYVKPYYSISNDKIDLCIDMLNVRAPDQAYNQIYKNFGWIEFTQAQRRAVSRNFDSAILLSTTGFITEGPGFGICFVKNNIVYTPKKDCLRSVTVDVVEDLCKSLNLTFIRTDITINDALVSDEGFICSTSGGITPVNKLEDTVYTHIITNLIKESYELRCI